MWGSPQKSYEFCVYSAFLTLHLRNAILVGKSNCHRTACQCGLAPRPRQTGVACRRGFQGL